MHAGVAAIAAAAAVSSESGDPVQVDHTCTSELPTAGGWAKLRQAGGWAAAAASLGTGYRDAESSTANEYVFHAKLAEALASAGARVVLAANQTPTLNDVTVAEARDLLAKLSARVTTLEAQLADGRLSIISTGTGTPGIDFRAVGDELIRAGDEADEGDGDDGEEPVIPTLGNNSTLSTVGLDTVDFGMTVSQAEAAWRSSTWSRRGCSSWSCRRPNRRRSRRRHRSTRRTVLRPRSR